MLIGQRLWWISSAALFASLMALAPARCQELRVVETRFDVDPLWEGFRNHLLPNPPKTTEQDFGFRPTQHAGGMRAGEIGGVVARSASPAWYAKEIPARTFADRLTVSGKFSVLKSEGGSGVMIGWFHEKSRGWRTPNSLAMRINGDGRKYRLFYEYGTTRGMTGGGGAFEGEMWQTTKTPPFVSDGTVHRWQLDYDPRSANEPGQITFRVDDRTYVTDVPLEHKADSATMNRFGIWNVQVPGDELEVFFDDLIVGDRTETFDADPAWQAQGNQVKFVDRVRRPYHDFGFQRSSHAGGQEGEVGGIVFRDERPAYYAGPTGKLSLADTLEASGTLTMLRAAADSGVLIGWFDSATKQANETPENERRQRNYLGIVLEGPSRIGHVLRPAYGTSEGPGAVAPVDDRWRVIRPDASVHRWLLRYDPRGAEGSGRIALTVDGDTKAFELAPGHRQLGATFDRFGLFNLQTGGHFVEVYLDDLKYTARR